MAGRLKKREVKCETCGTVFKSGIKNPQCSNPECRGTNVRPVEPDLTEKQKQLQEKPNLPPLPFMTGLKLQTQNNIQYLMNLGIGKSPEAILEKAIENMRLNFDGKGGKMSEIDGIEDIERLRKGRLLDAEIKRIEREAKGENNGTTISTDDDLAREFKMAQLNRLKSQSVSPLETMMAYQLFNKMEGNNGGKNDEVDALRKEIKEMRENQKYEDLRKSNEELKALVLEAAKNKSGDTQTSLITQMSTIFAKRDTDIERLRAEVESAKRDASSQILNEKLNRLEQAIGGSKSELATFKDTFGIVRDLSKEFNPEHKKSGMEAAQELIGNTITAIQKPILEPIGQAMAQSIANPKPQMPAQPQEMPQEFHQPIQQRQMSEDDISKGLVNISSE